jgi:hypothetical protein
MQDEKNKKDQTKNADVLENVIVYYTNGAEEQFKAIRITDNGIIIGQIRDKEFSPFGFIPKQSYNKIENAQKRRMMS